MRQMAGNKESMKVGVQMWFSTPAFLLNMFQRANPKVQVADIAAVMDELRMIKDEIVSIESSSQPQSETTAA